MSSLQINSTAILIGYDPEGKCVYSEIISLFDYYDSLHLWDESGTVKSMRLERLRGFLFDSCGVLSQEFESSFDLTTGIFKSGYARHSDGTLLQF